MLKQIIILLIILITICLSAHQKSKTALFVSVPHIGHINPLLRQANALYHRRGTEYNIYIISCSNIKTHVETNCLNTTIQFLDIGQCQNETELVSSFETVAAQTSTYLGILTLLEMVIEQYYPRMYKQMLNVIKPDMFNKQVTTIAVVDLVTYAGSDIADHFNIPYIINNADLLPGLGFHAILPSDYNPAIFSDPPQSIHSMGTNLLSRTLSPIFRYIFMGYLYFRFDRPFNYLRQTKFHFSNSIHFWSRYHSHMILVNNVFGLEYAHHIPPNVHLTGPMLSINLSSNYYLNQLSDEDRQWIESDSRPIIYVNFGTTVPMLKEQIEKIFHALISFDQYRIIWKLNQPDLLPIKSTATFRIVKWISSILGYLAHPNVHLFISHCGINSAYESIWIGTSILCIPILADQQDMAQRIEDAGVGKWLHKFKFTSDELKQTIESMLTKDEVTLREKNIKRIQRMMKLHGGVERAVDLIEIVAEYGMEGLVPINNSYPLYAYYDLDVYAVWLLILIGLQQLIVRYCCRYPRHSIPIQKSKKKIS